MFHKNKKGSITHINLPPNNLASHPPGNWLKAYPQKKDDWTKPAVDEFQPNWCDIGMMATLKLTWKQSTKIITDCVKDKRQFIISMIRNWAFVRILNKWNLCPKHQNKHLINKMIKNISLRPQKILKKPLHLMFQQISIHPFICRHNQRILKSRFFH